MNLLKPLVHFPMKESIPRTVLIIDVHYMRWLNLLCALHIRHQQPQMLHLTLQLVTSTSALVTPMLLLFVFLEQLALVIHIFVYILDQHNWHSMTILVVFAPIFRGYRQVSQDVPLGRYIRAVQG